MTDLQPYGPIEEAIQKSITPETASPKINSGFWKGVIVTLAIGGIIFWIISENKNKARQNNTKN